MSNKVALYTSVGQAFVSNSDGVVTGATATGTKHLGYLFHPSSVTTKLYVLRAIHVSMIAGSGGSQRLEVRRITAEAGTPGGTAGVVLKKNQDNDTSGAVVNFNPTNAPTQQTGVYFGEDVPVNANQVMLIPPTWVTNEYIMRAGQGEGFELIQNVIATIGTAPTFNMTFDWDEISV